MAIGFVLITAMPGFESKVRKSLDDIKFVTDRWMLFGEYDLIARVQADDEFDLTRCIVEEPHTGKDRERYQNAHWSELQITINCGFLPPKSSQLLDILPLEIALTRSLRATF